VRLQPSRQQPPDINLAPLIDVVFLLLIFFMVSTTFKHESEIKIELPRAGEKAAEEIERKLIDLTIDQEGRFYVNREAVVNTQLETLIRALGKAAGDKKDLPVLISADARTPHQAVMTAMDAASRSGLLHITFAATQVPQEP
jgi:biopolymer transport protein ExbD